MNLVIQERTDSLTLRYSAHDETSTVRWIHNQTREDKIDTCDSARCSRQCKMVKSNEIL